jgi:hypothetical protein
MNVTLLDIADLSFEVVFLGALLGQTLSSDAAGAGATPLAQIVDATTVGDDGVYAIVESNLWSFRHAWNRQSFEGKISTEG